jgi:hypothetical protein
MLGSAWFGDVSSSSGPEKYRENPVVVLNGRSDDISYMNPKSILMELILVYKNKKRLLTMAGN